MKHVCLLEEKSSALGSEAAANGECPYMLHLRWTIPALLRPYFGASLLCLPRCCRVYAQGQWPNRRTRLRIQCWCDWGQKSSRRQNRSTNLLKRSSHGGGDSKFVSEDRFAHGEATLCAWTSLVPSREQECDEKQKKGMIGFNRPHASFTKRSYRWAEWGRQRLGCAVSRTECAFKGEAA